MQSLFSLPTPGPALECTGVERVIQVADALLEATLTVPREARALIVLPHAGSATRFEPAQRFMTGVFEQVHLATLQVDLLTPEEEATLPINQYRNEDIALLAHRLLGVVDWIKEQSVTVDLRLGLFAAMRETVPAMIAATRSSRIAAMVSQGGCPDFFNEALTMLRVPTLLIVGRKEQARAAEMASEFFARTLCA